MVFTVENEDVKRQLERKGFECVGLIGDNIHRKKMFTMHGEESMISKREYPFIKKLTYERGKSELLKRRV